MKSSVDDAIERQNKDLCVKENIRFYVKSCSLMVWMTSKPVTQPSSPQINQTLHKIPTELVNGILQVHVSDAFASRDDYSNNMELQHEDNTSKLKTAIVKEDLV